MNNGSRKPATVSHCLKIFNRTQLCLQTGISTWLTNPIYYSLLPTSNTGSPFESTTPRSKRPTLIAWLRWEPTSPVHTVLIQHVPPRVQRSSPGSIRRNMAPSPWAPSCRKTSRHSVNICMTMATGRRSWGRHTSNPSEAAQSWIVKVWKAIRYCAILNSGRPSTTHTHTMVWF